MCGIAKYGKLFLTGRMVFHNTKVEDVSMRAPHYLEFKSNSSQPGWYRSQVVTDGGKTYMLWGWGGAERRRGQGQTELLTVLTVLASRCWSEHGAAGQQPRPSQPSPPPAPLCPPNSTETLRHILQSHTTTHHLLHHLHHLLHHHHHHHLHHHLHHLQHSLLLLTMKVWTQCGCGDVVCV